MPYQRTKWNRIYNDLLAQIQLGAIAPGSRLPQILDLAREWGVSYLTAHKIIRKLADEKYLYIVHGRGIYVSDSCINPEPEKKDNLRVGFLGWTTGEVYADIYRGIQCGLPENCRTIPLASPEEYSSFDVREAEMMFSNIIRCNCDSLVIHGDYNINYRVIKKLEKEFKQLIFSFYFSGQEEISGANRVVFDFYRGGYLAASHLLEQGYEKIVFLTYEDLKKFDMMRRNLSKMPGHDLLAGIIAACEDHGVDFYSQGMVLNKNCSSNAHNKAMQKKLTDLMQEKRTGFIGVNDVRAWPVYQAAAAAHLNIGSDVGMVGFLNLAQFRDNIYPALSSVAFNEAAAGRKIAELIVSGARNERIVIEPELIVRSSSIKD